MATRPAYVETEQKTGNVVITVSDDHARRSSKDV